MKNIEIRMAELSDLPILKEFEQGIITAERPYDITLKPGTISYYDLQALIEAVDSEVIVATCEDVVVGSAYIQFRQSKPYLQHETYGYLGFMFVAPEYRGHGVNGKIIEELKRIARAKEVTELRLDVYDGNDAALKAYDKAGFERYLINMRIGI